MQKYAKSSKKYMQNGPKICLFSPIKHLFWLKKNGQNRRFNLWKCAASGCICKDPEWILSIFMQFDEGPDDFWTVFRYFRSILTPFWAIFDPIGGYIGRFGDFGTKIESFWGDFRLILDHFWVDLGCKILPKFTTMMQKCAFHAKI